MVELSQTQQFIVEMAQACGWPIVVLLSVLLLRGHLGALLDRLESATIKGATLKFHQKIANIESEASKLGGADQSVFPNQSAEEGARLLDLARTHPRAAIVDSWVRLEDELRQAAIRLGGTPDQRRPIQSVISILRQRSDLPDGFYTVVEDLRQVRNDAVHYMEMKESRLGNVVSYVRFAAQMADLTRRAAHKK